MDVPLTVHCAAEIGEVEGRGGEGHDGCRSLIEPALCESRSRRANGREGDPLRSSGSALDCLPLNYRSIHSSRLGSRSRLYIYSLSCAPKDSPDLCILSRVAPLPARSSAMPPPRAISASFHRGGTSRGLLLRASVLSAYSSSVRSNIIRTALGSPDPFGRQIDGLGGGVSSLSKCAVVGLPGEGKEEAKRSGAMEGVSWADDGEKEGVGKWDVVYRFCQVGVRDRTLDW